MTVESTEYSNNPANFTAEAIADRQNEFALRAAMDEAAINYYMCKIDAAEKNAIALQAIEKQFNDKWTVERRNKLLADAYIANIAADGSRAIHSAATDALQGYIFDRDYVIPEGHPANNLPVWQNNQTVLND